MKYLLAGFLAFSGAVPISKASHRAIPAAKKEVSEVKCVEYLHYCVRLCDTEKCLGKEKIKKPQDYVCDDSYLQDEVCLKTAEDLAQMYSKVLSKKEEEEYFANDDKGGQIPKAAAHNGFMEVEKAGVINACPLPVVETHLWPTKEIPFCYDATVLHADARTKAAYVAAIRIISDNTIVTFKEVACNAAGHKVKFAYVRGEAESWVGHCYEHGGSCYWADATHALPSAGGANAANVVSTHQTIKFDYVRGNGMTAAHEILHTLGFMHVQMRSDRDEYVTVEDAVTSANNCGSAAAYGASTDTSANYNYESIMHYPASSAQCKTITEVAADVAQHKGEHRTGSAAKMGQMVDWQATDSKAVEEAYKNKPAIVP